MSRVVWNFAGVMAVLVVSCLVLMVVAMWYERKSLPTADPEAILADRFAKGEIDEAEYARRLGVIRYGPPIKLPE